MNESRRALAEAIPSAMPTSAFAWIELITILAPIIKQMFQRWLDQRKSVGASFDFRTFLRDILWPILREIIEGWLNQTTVDPTPDPAPPKVV